MLPFSCARYQWLLQLTTTPTPCQTAKFVGKLEPTSRLFTPSTSEDHLPLTDRPAELWIVETNHRDHTHWRILEKFLDDFAINPLGAPPEYASASCAPTGTLSWNMMMLCVRLGSFLKFWMVDPTMPWRSWGCRSHSLLILLRDKNSLSFVSRVKRTD